MMHATHISVNELLIAYLQPQSITRITNYVRLSHNLQWLPTKFYNIERTISPQSIFLANDVFPLWLDYSSLTISSSIQKSDRYIYIMGYYHDRTFNQIIVYFDGASRNYPHGPAGCGWVICEMDDDGADGDFIKQGKTYLGHNGISHNQAKYQGLYEALKYLVVWNISCHKLYIRGDSQIVINQLVDVAPETYQKRSNSSSSSNHNNNNNNNIVVDCHYEKVVNMLEQIQIADPNFIKYTHIDRCRNDVADELANNAIDDWLLYQ